LRTFGDDEMLGFHGNPKMAVGIAPRALKARNITEKTADYANITSV